jgi:acyl transferase domain-containing protein/NAD(P)-dependent dehydrogenase (short-subunit alcohol dehydrogenase family)
MSDQPSHAPNANPTSEPAADPIAIVGIGCMFPKAQDLESYWANIRDGIDGITETPSTHWSTEDYYDANPDTPDMTYGRRGGFLEQSDFNPLEFGISPRDVEATDTAQLLGMAIAKQALADAGYAADDPELPRDRISVILGVTGTLELVIPLGARLGHPIWRRALKDAGVDPVTSEEVVERIRDSYVGWQENSFPGLLGNVVAGRIANRLDLHGTNCVVDSACASSLSAVHLAIMELQAGRADMVVTGGVDTFNDIFMYMCFSKTPALSPTGDAKPFAANSDGTILGEGLGMMVLKRLSDAERDGDRIYAIIRGMGSSSDGKGNAVYAPSAEGQARALRNAYQNAQVDPATIELVEAHGTGTKVGDATEIRGLTSVYGDADREGSWCALGSVKSMIGHTKAAAGAAGLIKAAMALHHRVLPPTLKVAAPNEAAAPNTTPFYVNTEIRPWLPSRKHPRRAGVSAFGFGGSNFHCVLEEYVAPDPVAAEVDWDGRVQILPLSADDRSGLRIILEDLHAAITAQGQWSTVRGIAAKARAEFNPQLHCRIVLVIESTSQTPSQLVRSAIDALEQNQGLEQWSSPQGIWFGSGPQSGGIAAVFPGQGSQYPGMLRELLCRFPDAQEALANANAAGQGKELSDHIYPHPAFDDETKLRHSDALRQTDVAQPAIGAVSLGAWNILKSFGVVVSATTGHSYGELTALHAAKKISEIDFHTLSWLRGKFMARGDGDRGRMLAVFAKPMVVDQFLKQHDLKLVLANRNAPNQTVLSGPSDVITRAAAKLQAEGTPCKPLPVAAAFHSPLVAEATAPFGELLEDVAFHKGECPVYANTSAEPYPDKSEPSRRLLAGQLASPVEFQRCIENMRKSGITTFVEVGPGNALTGLIRATLDGDPKVWTTAVDASHSKNRDDLAKTLACLVAAGHHVELDLWDAGYLQRHNDNLAQKRPAFTVPLSGANYVARREAKAPSSPPIAPQAIPTPSPSAQPAPALRPLPPTTSDTPVPADHQNLIAQALRANQESLQALAQMQQQTAELHRRFLETQQQASSSFEQLLAQQQIALGTNPTVVSQAASPAVPSPSTANRRPEPQPPVEPQAVANTPSLDLTNTTARPDLATPILLAVVADKTGYPVEMLELSMGLDADLGIDSIKRVEILSALQEQLPDAPVVKPEHLGELTTLGQIADFLNADGSSSGDQKVAAAEATIQPIAQSAGNAHVETVLLGVVADKTGYPAEMLELDMGLDADLGIDSIKRVEILSALQEQLPDAPIVKPEHLGELSTLGQIAAFLSGPDAPSSSSPPSSVDTPANASATDHLQEVLLAIVADKTGYPVEMLELEMGLDADLGIDSIKRVEILSALQEQLPAAPIVKPEHLGELHTLQHIVDFLASSSEDSSQTAQPPAPPGSPQPTDNPGITRLILARRQIADTPQGKNEFPAEALIWVTRTTDGLSKAVVGQLRQLGIKADEVERTTTAASPAELCGLIIIADATPQPRFLHESLALAKQVAAQLRLAGENGVARFVTISRLDGSFGLLNLSASNIRSGGLAGLAKTVSHEWPQVRAQAIDMAANELDHAWASERIVAQFLADDEHMEVGISRQGTCLIETIAEKLPVQDPVGPASLSVEDVVLITGGARGITAEIAVALAKHYQPKLVLLGRSPFPAPEPSWLLELEDETTIKQAILKQAQTSEPSAKLRPADLTDRYTTILNNREILRNIRRMEQAGAKVSYQAVDVRDSRNLETCLRTVSEKFGPVTGLVHGAGVLADSYIADKTDAEVERVLATKVDGAEALLNALCDCELKVIVHFSSSTARYGRIGQADYAVANEVLNKLAQREAQRRPSCKVHSINWGPWDGGMVTPALREMFADEGISVIGLEAGANYLIEELRNPHGPVEIVILGQGSLVPSSEHKEAGDAPGLSAVPELPTILERRISLEDHPFLSSHVLDGKAVLPVAMTLELLGHAALHGNPGLRLRGVQNLRVFKGVALREGDTVNLRVCADKAQKVDGVFVVPTELCSTDDQGSRVLHARATINLGTSLDQAPVPAPAAVLPPYPRSVEDAYSQQLFHGRHLQGLTSVVGCETNIGKLASIIAHCDSAPPPKSWLHQPLRSRWIADPLALDCAFQLMILWSFEANKQGSLPTSIGHYQQFVASFPDQGVRIEIRVQSNGTGKAKADIDWLNEQGEVLARMTNYECVVDASLHAAFQRNTLESNTAARR